MAISALLHRDRLGTPTTRRSLRRRLRDGDTQGASHRRVSASALLFQRDLHAQLSQEIHLDEVPVGFIDEALTDKHTGPSTAVWGRFCAHGASHPST